MNRPSPDEERRKIFRRMEWVFVYAPPILAVLVSAFGAAILALFVPVPGTNYLGRWALGILLLLVLSAIAFIGNRWWERRRGGAPGRSDENENSGGTE